MHLALHCFEQLVNTSRFQSRSNYTVQKKHYRTLWGLLDLIGFVRVMSCESHWFWKLPHLVTIFCVVYYLNVTMQNIHKISSSVLFIEFTLGRWKHLKHLNSKTTHWKTKPNQMTKNCNLITQRSRPNCSEKSLKGGEKKLVMYSLSYFLLHCDALTDFPEGPLKFIF